MRTYGRVYDENGNLTKWVMVTTDANGDNTAVYATTLAQALKQNLNESPFFANYGIPDHQSLMMRLAPDYYAAQTQIQFAPYFANLSIARAISADGITPTYSVNITTNQGTEMFFEVPQ